MYQHFEQKIRRKELKINEANQIQELLLTMPIQTLLMARFIIGCRTVAHETYRSTTNKYDISIMYNYVSQIIYEALT